MRFLALLVFALAACRTANQPEPLPVRIVDVPARTVVALSGTGDRAAGEATIREFTDHFESQGLSPAGLLMLACTLDGTRHSVMVPVLSGTKPEAPLRLQDVPAVKAAAVVLVGRQEKIAKRFSEIDRWIEANGWRAEGPRIEVRLPSGNRTEVLVPVVRAE